MAEGGLVSVGDVEETVIVLSLLIHMCHQSICKQSLVIISLTSFEQVLSVDEEVEGILFGKFYPLPDDVVEVIGSQVVRDEVPKE